MKKPFVPNRPQQSTDTHRVNHQIRVPEVRVVGDNVEGGIYPIREAIKMAEEQGLDLVEISPTAQPPVCKITDFSKFKYEQKKKQKEMKSNAHKTVLKEIRFSPTTDEHDFNFKTKHATSFLKEGNKVKAYVQFFGRSIVYKEHGFELLEKFIQALDDVGKVEQPVKLEGRRMGVVLSPKNAK